MSTSLLDRFLWRTSLTAPEHPQTRMIATEYSDIRVRDTGGDQPAVVLFCDPPITIEAYDDLISEFANEYRIVVMELPCFGFSKPRSGDAYRFYTAVDAIEKALHLLNLGPVFLCGPCICGFVVTEIVRRADIDVRGVVLMQVPDLAGMHEWQGRMDPRNLLSKKYFGQLLVKYKALPMISSWLKFSTAKTYDSALLVKMTTNLIRAGAAYPLASMYQRWDTVSDAAVSVPALVVWGQQDRSHSETDPKSTLAHVPNATVVEFDCCGHFSELENPQKFVKQVLPFFKHNAPIKPGET